AYLTLYETLTTLAKLIAPILPFMAEEMHQNLVRAVDSAAPSSVHLCRFPDVDESLIDEALERDMAVVRRVVELGLAARSASKIRVRQPLPAAKVALGGSGQWPVDLEELAKDELNVKAIDQAGEETVAERTFRANLPLLGPKLGSRLREVRAAVEGGQVEALSNGGYRAAGVELSADEVFVTLKGREGFEVAGDQDVLVALDTALTPELLAEGRARELSRKINELRRDLGFDIADRIKVRYDASPGWEQVIEANRSYLANETLAVEITRGVASASWQGELDAEPIALELTRA
ncbi:MAG TPA: DUF5915 domain-containing protein, partial [Chloroflexota bacterium]|nr:DUF5915 domain-containing protein [Chloroflexota bacterium]